MKRTAYQEASTAAQAKQAKPNAPRKPVVASTGATIGTTAHSNWKRRQAKKLVEAFKAQFGEAWHQEFRNPGKGNTDDVKDPPQGSTKKSTKPENLICFFKDYQSLFDAIGAPSRRGRNLANAAEKVSVDAIQEHLNNVAVALHTATDLTDRGYQALINYTSNVWVDDHLERLILPWGTSEMA